MNMKKCLVSALILVSSTGLFAKTWEVEINGMSCEGCIKSITSELKKFHAVKDVTISLEKKKGTVVSDDKAKDFGPEQIKKAVENAGYKTGAIATK